MPIVDRRPISERTAEKANAQKKDPKWRILVSELEDLTPDQVLVLAPDQGDTLRALKVQVSRAANAAGRKDVIEYGVNPQDQLEVWLREKPRQKRGPRKKRDES